MYKIQVGSVKGRYKIQSASFKSSTRHK